MSKTRTKKHEFPERVITIGYKEGNKYQHKMADHRDNPHTWAQYPGLADTSDPRFTHVGEYRLVRVFRIIREGPRLE